MFNEFAERKNNILSSTGEYKNLLKKIILAVFIVSIILVGFIFRWRKTENATQKIVINGWEFPKEEGEHSNLEFEWWYFAGHLEEEGSPENKFGVTLIFHKNPPHVKVNLVDGVQQKNFSSKIEIDQYDFISEEKLAIKKDRNYWLEEELFKYKIHFQFDNNEIDLSLDSLKYPFPGYNIADAFFYKQTRVKSTGKLSFSGKKYKVKGWGWIDHQGFKIIPFPPNFRWHAIQLDNNTELVFQLNGPEKTSLSLHKDNQTEQINSDSYSIDDIDHWTNPETNYKYPIRFKLKIPAKNVDLEVVAITNNQVIREVEYGSYEGSCQITGSFEGQVVTGRAQLEVINFP